MRSSACAVVSAEGVACAAVSYVAVPLASAAAAETAVALDGSAPSADTQRSG